MTKQEALAIAKSSNPLMRGASADPKYVGIIIECIEKQIPQKVEWEVEWTLYHMWGVEKEVPVCPTCDYYLTSIEFIDANICERTGHCEFLKVSYCEHCGQAIDWSDTND